MATRPIKSKQKRELGKITRLDPQRGFGFIFDELNVSRFFHASACQDVAIEDLMPGDKVSFEPGDGQKGPAAYKVKREER